MSEGGEGERGRWWRPPQAGYAGRVSRGRGTRGKRRRVERAGGVAGMCRDAPVRDSHIDDCGGVDLGEVTRRVRHRAKDCND